MGVFRNECVEDQLELLRVQNVARVPSVGQYTPVISSPEMASAGTDHRDSILLLRECRCPHRDRKAPT